MKITWEDVAAAIMLTWMVAAITFGRQTLAIAGVTLSTVVLVALYRRALARMRLAGIDKTATIHQVKIPCRTAPGGYETIFFITGRIDRYDEDRVKRAATVLLGEQLEVETSE